MKKRNDTVEPATLTLNQSTVEDVAKQMNIVMTVKYHQVSKKIFYVEFEAPDNHYWPTRGGTHILMVSKKKLSVPEFWLKVISELAKAGPLHHCSEGCPHWNTKHKFCWYWRCEQRKRAGLPAYGF